MPKAVYHSSCRDKHSWPRCGSNLGPLTLQLGVLTTQLLRPTDCSQWHLLPTVCIYQADVFVCWRVCGFIADSDSCQLCDVYTSCLAITERLTMPDQLLHKYTQNHRWMYDRIPHQVKQWAGDRGITAEDMENSQHTDFNKDTINESASVACSNIRLWKLDSQKEWRNTSLRWKDLEGCCGFRGQQRKQMSGFLTKLE